MRDYKLAELDFDLEALPGVEAGVFEPTAGELEPGHEGRVGSPAKCVGAPAARFLKPQYLGVRFGCGMHGALR